MPNRFGSVRCVCALLLLPVVPSAFSQNFRSPLILAPYSLDFGKVLVGKPSNSMSVNVLNNGESAQVISGIAITGEFAETDNCPKAPAALAMQAACEIKVTFTPSATAAGTGTLTVSDATSGTQLMAKLSGSGTPGKPSAAISPGSLTFPAQPLGIDSPPKTLVVTNTGTEMLYVTNVLVNADFMALPGSTCVNMNAPLSPNATCTIQVVFAPLGAGPRSGEALITDNGEDSPQKVPLSGTGASK